jgi:hypothetical protein
MSPPDGAGRGPVLRERTTVAVVLPSVDQLCYRATDRPDQRRHQPQAFPARDRFLMKDR